MHKIEELVSDLLKSARPDRGDDETAVAYRLCEQIIHAFTNIIIYLFCVWKGVTSYEIDGDKLSDVKYQIYHYLEDAEQVFMQMRGHAETEHDRFTGFESLQTADTLLGLLIENALYIADGEPENDRDRSSSPRFDLRYVYSRYTADSINEAKRHATVRIHKQVKLLTEEIETVRSVLEEQRSVFDMLFQKRESALQALDFRVKRRALDHLEETARHFQRLLEHAAQAADWNEHYINVRGEDNFKAIYIFTAVTVIFLPLSFVAGLLGMNVSDVRTTTDTQWLFWAVAIPFTILVLTICLALVQWKSLLRRAFNAVVRTCLSRSRRRLVA